ncbi:RidA family protein [Leucobacter sp. NPDC077196]|uniref:RidA family protein n=1 Tax=Leucobacter sp. NPDC077196 TaxID=3154959 RepID=UPI003434E44B
MTTAAPLTRIPEDTGAALSAQTTIVGELAFTTAIPVDASGDVTGDIESQSRRVLERLEAKLTAAGSGLDRIAHLTIHLCDIPTNKDAFNAVYREVMPEGTRPVRCLVGVAALARPEMLVEVTAIAAVRHQ